MGQNTPPPAKKEEPVAEKPQPQAEKPELLTKPAVKKQHAWLMNGSDAAFQTDLSAYPGPTYGMFLIYPTAELIKRFGIS